MKKRLLCLALVFAMTATQAMPVAASSRKQELQTQKSQTQSKLSEAESQVNTLENKKNELMGQINSTQQELVTIMTQIDMLKEEITDKEEDIKETQEDLKEAEADRDEQYESMKKRIQYLYENGGTDSWAQILLESDSITDMLSKIENNGKMYDYDREALEKMKAVVQEVQDLENQLITEKAELEDSKKEQEDKQDTLETKMADLKASASDYESQIATVKAQAEERRIAADPERRGSRCQSCRGSKKAGRCSGGSTGRSVFKQQQFRKYRCYKQRNYHSCHRKYRKYCKQCRRRKPEYSCRRRACRGYQQQCFL